MNESAAGFDNPEDIVMTDLDSTSKGISSNCGIICPFQITEAPPWSNPTGVERALFKAILHHISESLTLVPPAHRMALMREYTQAIVTTSEYGTSSVVGPAEQLMDDTQQNQDT